MWEFFEETANILWFILSVLVVIILDYFIATEFAHIAEMKGHERDRYFWFTFIFMPIGMLMVVALPDRGTTAPKAPVAPIQTPAPKKVSLPEVNLDIQEAPTVPPATIQTVICPVCSTAQSAESKKCLCCGHSLTK